MFCDSDYLIWLFDKVLNKFSYPFAIQNDNVPVSEKFFYLG